VTPTTKQAGEATVRAAPRTGETISHGVLLAVCCLLSYKIITVPKRHIQMKRLDF
jgi:hypothetical protein